MNYKSFNLGDWIGHISGAIEDERELDGNEMRDLVEFLTTLSKEPILDKIRAEVIAKYPKNYAGEPELGGSACEFSLNQILQIIDKYKAEMERINGKIYRCR